MARLTRKATQLKHSRGSADSRLEGRRKSFDALKDTEQRGRTRPGSTNAHKQG